MAPPLMLQTWTMATPVITGIAARGGSPVPAEGDAPLSILDRAGYTATLATNSEFEILRYLRPGDVVSATTTFESISEEKSTRMGPGSIRHLGDRVHGPGRRGRRPSTLPHLEVPCVGGHRRERAARSHRDPRHAVLLGRRQGAPAPDPALCRLSACCAIHPVPCVPSATRWPGTRSRPPGAASVYSFVMPQHPQFPFMEYPYVVALVELEEGTRLVTNIVGAAPETSHRMPVG